MQWIECGKRGCNPGGEGTLNVKVTGMLVGNFLENPKKYPDFDFKPTQILRVVLGKMASIFQKFSRRPPQKIPKSEFYTLKNTRSIPITLLWKCLPLPPGTAIHAMKEIFNDEETDGVILLDASNAFNNMMPQMHLII